MTNQDRTVAEMQARMFATAKVSEAHSVAQDLTIFFREKDIDPLVGLTAMTILVGTIIGLISSSKEGSEDVINATTNTIRIAADEIVDRK